MKQRQFTIREMKNLGFGKSSMESRIIDEALEVIESLKMEKGQPVSTTFRFNAIVLNCIWMIFGGERMTHDGADLRRLMTAIAM